MLWTDCPDDDTCDKCLDVAFESGNDIACLNEKFPDTKCILEGNFINGGAIVFVSSEQCINGGDMDHIQVHLVLGFCIESGKIRMNQIRMTEVITNQKRMSKGIPSLLQ